MLLAHRLLTVGLLGIGIAATTTAQAGNQLFHGSWSVKSFGNECSSAASGASPGPYCGNGAPESLVYSAVGLPQGIQCNADQPRCPFQSTPTNGTGMFAPLGGSQIMALFCAPWVSWQGNGTTARPAKGDTAVYTGMPGGLIPPLYRNPAFFTAGGQPGATFCTATSTGATPGGKGLIQAGNPVTGTWAATTTGTQQGGFTFGPAPVGGAGIRATGVAGEFVGLYPYKYSYSYATLRNQTGFFAPGSGPGDFTVKQYQGANTIARMKVKQGAAKFGGTMTMLGALTSKVCYYRNGGCSMGEMNWRYDAIGTSAIRSAGGVVTAGHLVTYVGYYYNTALMQTSTVNVEGSRFPWTTGSVTLTATGRGPHKTVHYTQGFDNRTSTSGNGTIQLVTPVLTRWLQPAANFETGGVGILKLHFIEYDSFDGDGVADEIDNCSEVPNSDQDDTDGDDCGNLCDADYDQSGSTAIADFNLFRSAFLTPSPLFKHVEPVVDSNVSVADFNFFRLAFLASPPGPSGTTEGTIACP
jgi:hypothetical protein